MKIIMSHFST